MARVYVSSTIADLKRERRAVMDWLVAAQHQVVHSYRPDGETVRESCLDDVDSCDLYVLIAGHRYGFQPSDGNPDSLSITHLEFRRAGESGKPRVALLRTSIPDVSLSDMEDPRRAALVVAFRAEVSRDVRPALFHDESGLISSLSTGLQGVLEKLGGTSDGVRPAARRAAGPVLRLAPRPPFLAGRRNCWPILAAGWHATEKRGRQWWYCRGSLARGRRRWLSNTRTGIWLKQGWCGSFRPKMQPFWRPDSLSWLPSLDPEISEAGIP
jgi:hypothetical protein